MISKNNQPIKDMNDWEKVICPKDWIKGRSAYSLANFVLNKTGLETIKTILQAFLKDEIDFKEAIPEYEVKFDKFGGRGRFHDLGIFGKLKSSNKTIFVGVESKVDEPFGQTVSEAYISATIKRLNGKKTNAPERVKKLLEQNFGTNIKSKHFDIRYQLLYATMGTLEEKADISIFFTIVFKTNSGDNKYDEKKGKKNHQDYCQFIQNVISEKISCDTDNVEIHKLTIDNKKIYSVYTEMEP